MHRIVALVLLAAAMSGCGTHQFTPEEYPLRDGLIAAFDVAGTVTISNAQPSTDPFIVYSFSGSKLSSDLKSITEVMVQQATKELHKNGQPIESTAEKSIALAVTSLRSTYIAFYWHSNIEFRATLGDGQTLDFRVPHTSGVLAQDLDGCIAEGVMTLLNDARVTAYLKH